MSNRAGGNVGDHSTGLRMCQAHPRIAPARSATGESRDRREVEAFVDIREPQGHGRLRERHRAVETFQDVGDPSVLLTRMALDARLVA